MPSFPQGCSVRAKVDFLVQGPANAILAPYGVYSFLLIYLFLGVFFPPIYIVNGKHLVDG